MQTQIAISSTQQETRAPPTSLQTIATDNSTHRLSQLKNFAVLVAGAFNGLPIRFKNPQRHLYAPTPLQTTTMRRVLSTLKTHQHVECTCVILISRLHPPTLTLSPLLERNRYDTSVFNSSKQCCACGGGEHNLLVDANVSNSEGYTCSDIAVFRRYGYEDLCTSAYDTPQFVASEMCLVCGGGQVMEDSWYETPETQEVQESQAVTGCDDSMWDGRVDSYGYVCDGYVGYADDCGGYDDSDFTSNEMCCACGGGEDQRRSSRRSDSRFEFRRRF